MRWLALTAVMLAVWTAGCDRNESPADHSTDGDEVDASAVDDTEHRVVRSEQWPQEIERVVSMAPNVTEILFELGVGDRVVAVTRYCDWPEEVEQLPSIGGGLNPDYEAILAAEPDLVAGVADGLDEQFAEQLDRADLAYGFVAIEGVESVRVAIERLGRWLDVQTRAEALTERFDTRLDEASETARETIGQRRWKVLLVVGHDPVVAAGADSFGDELLELAGLQNALSEDAALYPVLDAEKILELNPDLVVDTTVGPTENGGEGYWQRFDSLDAVEHGRVVHIDDPVMLRPGPRTPRAVERLVRAVEEL